MISDEHRTQVLEAAAGVGAVTAALEYRRDPLVMVTAQLFEDLIATVLT